MNKIRLLVNIILGTFTPPFKTRDALAVYQRKALKNYFIFLRQNSPYFKKYDFKELSELPLMNKTIMMANFNELNTVGIDKKEALALAINAERTRNFTPKINNVTIGLSSGTSGNKGLFLVSEVDKFQYIKAIYLKVLRPLKFRKTRVALFFRANSNLYESVKSLFLKFLFLDLTKELSPQILQLNEYNPHILVAPPALLNILATKKKNEEIAIQPEKIISVAEILEDDVRKNIEQAFGISVHQMYQCTEGFLASTCKHGTLHLHEDYIHIEKKWVDMENKRFYPIITDFTRRTQPIIRYELNDILVEDDPCACGSVFTAIKKIEGRSDDIFLFKRRENQVIIIFPDEIRNCVIIASDNIDNYTVLQIDENTVHFAIKAILSSEHDKESAKVKQALQELFRKKQVDEVNITENKWNDVVLFQKQRRIKNLTHEI